MLEISTFVLGPVETNSYLIGDSVTRQAVVIDPAWDGPVLADEILRKGWELQSIWLTHAHFDHFAGTAGILKALGANAPVALHPADLPLWRVRGGASLFGFNIDPGPEPTIRLAHRQVLWAGIYEFQVRHSPGHSPGHVIFYCQAEKAVFCGDVIFGGSIGRTDLPGGSYETLMESIHSQVMSLPDDTQLYCGHGPATSVGLERLENPFLI